MSWIPQRLLAFFSCSSCWSFSLEARQRQLLIAQGQKALWSLSQQFVGAIAKGWGDNNWLWEGVQIPAILLLTPAWTGNCFSKGNASHEGVGCQPPSAFRPHHMVTQGRLMDHPQLLSNCLPQAALALPFLVLQKPCKEVPETSSTISLQALGWRSFLTLEFSEVWKHGNFLMTGSTIDLEILKYFFLLLLEIYACFWDLSCSLWTLRQSIHLIFFFFCFFWQ